jgi:flagellar basal-body rod protein FlgB
MTLDPLVGRLQTVLDLRQLQHTVTASNLANADTPGYRAKVVEFDALLASVVAGDHQLRTTDPRHVASSAGDAAHPVFTELDPAPWSVDGNSVLAERETARLQTNALLYEAVTRGLDKKLALLKFAASDGRS